eukprot:CAMPEP_0172866216 /NCGR_PEP_ID=MMETSP1075-20121228/81857_1 /TAXON_ID=2916 /ORGANISM="Ceratium fusus, Strain PA161109" /LENGTH=344 /DNA_ID=CAMNT_0013715357 /DNA_START=195 /DNA_END=1229 /DNA_ORIENTATION=-
MILWLALLLIPVVTQDPVHSVFQCTNPLFRGYWASNESSVARLQDRPVARTDLVRCKMWNYHASCCNPSLEGTQQLMFDSRLKQLTADVQLLASQARAVQSLQQSDVYEQADALERALFDKAFDSFQPALDHAPLCIEAVMSFVAGMICFSCNPRWDMFVSQAEDGEINSVNITAESCIYVGQRCGQFGRAALHVVRHIMSSSLAKSVGGPLGGPLPDFGMFKNRIATCSWLRDVIALHPFLGALSATSNVDRQIGNQQSMGRSTVPSLTPRAQRNDNPRTSVLPTGLVALLVPSDGRMSKQSQTGIKRAQLALDPVGDGQRSGFRLTAAFEAASFRRLFGQAF